VKELRSFVSRNVEAINSKLGTLKGSFLCCAEYYDCSGPHILGEFCSWIFEEGKFYFNLTDSVNLIVASRKGFRQYSLKPFVVFYYRKY
jgi:hypothetical protein